MSRMEESESRVRTCVTADGHRSTVVSGRARARPAPGDPFDWLRLHALVLAPAPREEWDRVEEYRFSGGVLEYVITDVERQKP